MGFFSSISTSFQGHIIDITHLPLSSFYDAHACESRAPSIGFLKEQVILCQHINGKYQGCWFARMDPLEGEQHVFLKEEELKEIYQILNQLNR